MNAGEITIMTKKNSILSIIIVSYNTKKLLTQCLDSLNAVRTELDFEVIVSDNASSDGSVEAVKNDYPWVTLIESTQNQGFAKGNNSARSMCQGKYVLFLNSDTIVHKSTLKESVRYLENNPKVASMTCKTLLPSGKLDKDVRRSFPTPWVAFTHLVLPLDRLIPKSKVFAKYWYSYIDESTIHEVDVIQGAFHMSRKAVLDSLDWFDEDYFLDGEDIDLCWRIKEAGWKIYYYPEVTITHVKKASKRTTDKSKRKRFVASGADAMELFYRKRLWMRYPLLLNMLIVAGIRLVKNLRLFKLTFS